MTQNLHTDEAYARAAERRAAAEREYAQQKRAEADRVEGELKDRARSQWVGDASSFEAAWNAGGRLAALKNESDRRAAARRATAERQLKSTF